MNIADDAMPVRPVEPPLEACCGNDCTPCVFDRYEADLARYEAAVRQMTNRADADDAPVGAACGPTAGA